MSTEPKQYRKKPVMIEAMKWDGTAEGAGSIINWVLSLGEHSARFINEGYWHPLRRRDELTLSGRATLDGQSPSFIKIETLEGDHRADAGDFIIKGVQGEFYPCKPDIFAATYEEAKS